MIHTPHLQLVKSFSFEAYPFRIPQTLSYPLDASRNSIKDNLLHAARRAGIKDYTLTDNFHDIALHLRKQRDYERVKFALNSGDGPFTKTFILKGVVQNWRALRKHCKHVQNVIDRKTHLAGRITINADKNSESVIVVAANIGAYLDFTDLTSNVPIFEHGHRY